MTTLFMIYGVGAGVTLLLFGFFLVLALALGATHPKGLYWEVLKSLPLLLVGWPIYISMMLYITSTLFLDMYRDK